MLESLLLPHLNAALSAVFEDVEAHQLKASLLNGSLILRNLKIKSDALVPLSLPIEATYGHVGTLKIKVRLFLETSIRDPAAIIKPQLLGKFLVSNFKSLFLLFGVSAQNLYGSPIPASTLKHSKLQDPSL